MERTWTDNGRLEWPLPSMASGGWRFALGGGGTHCHLSDEFCGADSVAVSVVCFFFRFVSFVHSWRTRCRCTGSHPHRIRQTFLFASDGFVGTGLCFFLFFENGNHRPVFVLPSGTLFLSFFLFQGRNFLFRYKNESWFFFSLMVSRFSFGIEWFLIWFWKMELLFRIFELDFLRAIFSHFCYRNQPKGSAVSGPENNQWSPEKKRKIAKYKPKRSKKTSLTIDRSRRRKWRQMTRGRESLIRRRRLMKSGPSDRRPWPTWFDQWPTR